MATIQHFITDTEVRNYTFQDQSIQLEINAKIFPPSKFGALYGHYLKVLPGEKVIDIGTGCGIFAILASKLGGDVYATDISSDAIVAAQKNTRKNEVNVKLAVGKYFADFNEKFDVIIVNLPTEVVPHDYLNCIGDELSGTISGGNTGSELVLEFLQLAPQYMNKNSRIYIQIHTLSDFHKSLNSIVDTYEAKLIGFNAFPNKEFVADNIAYYKDLNNNGLIDIYHNDGVWMSNAFFFELSLKN